MRRVFTLLILILFLGKSYSSAQLQSPALRLHSLNAGFAVGATRLSKNGSHGTGYSFSLKEQYHFAGVLYRSIGVNYTCLRGLHRFDGAGEEQNYRSAYIGLPVGLGFGMGDDRGRFYTEAGLLPAYYFKTHPAISNTRSFGLGFTIETGFTLKSGRAAQRGFQIGMFGLWHCIPAPSYDSGKSLVYSFAGVGLLVRF